MNRIKRLACIGLVVLLPACTHFTKIPQTEKDSSGWSKEVREVAAYSYNYAQMSNNAYDEKKRRHIVLNPDIGLLEDPFQNDKIGFAYNVYHTGAKESPASIIIAYRGTELDDFDDMWYGNIRLKQNKKALDVHDRLNKKYNGIPIIVTGHSLGGALATHVSLNTDNAEAIVFDSSPRFRKKGNFENKRNSIVEYGEINKILRIFGSEPTQTYTSLNCIKGGNPLFNHSMYKLAKCLTKIATHSSDKAQASWAVNFANETNDFPAQRAEHLKTVATKKP